MTEAVKGQHFPQGDYATNEWPEWRKKVTTRARRIEGPFSVETREGVLTCPDGYLAVDSHGYPYPIAHDEFKAIYEPVLATDA